MKKSIKPSTLFLLFVFLSCTLSENAIIDAFRSGADRWQKQLAPDLRLNIFIADLQRSGRQWVLSGETTVSELKPLIIALADSLIGQSNYKDQFNILPDSTLGDSLYAIVKVSVANMRRIPSHAAELDNQEIMGKVVRILKKESGWYNVQTDYGYLGWMNSSSLYRTNESGIQDWEKGDMVRVTDLNGRIFSEPDYNSTPVADVVLNVRLQKVKPANGWTLVRTPDGRTGYIPNNSVVPSNESNRSMSSINESIIRVATSMMGVPYLWGGNSSKANDCSGFTQTVFKANGLQLPRDARQQALVGEEVIPDSDFSNILPGDLFFFGSEDRITHVGISLGGAPFIHQSGDVHLNSLDPQADNFNAYRYNTLKKIKRIIEAE